MDVTELYKQNPKSLAIYMAGLLKQAASSWDSTKLFVDYHRILKRALSKADLHQFDRMLFQEFQILKGKNAEIQD